MKLLFTILLLFLTGISSVVLATENEKTIKTSRDFSIRCRSLSIANAPEKLITVTVFAEYSSKDQMILINIDATTSNDPKPFTLNYPLDFEVFQQKFDSLFIKRKNESLSVSYSSYLDVFYWIVTITEDNNVPLAGVLTTSQYVMISSDNNGKIKNHTERTKLVRNEVDSLEIKSAKAKKIELESSEFINKESNSLNLDLANIQIEIKSKNDSLKTIEEYKQSLETTFLGVTDTTIKNSLIVLKIGTLEKVKALKESLVFLNYKLNQINQKLTLLDNQNKSKTIPNDLNDAINARKAVTEQRSRLENLHIRKVSHVQYQFEKGYLERIQVYIESPGTENLEVFENSYPIGFSSISNYQNFTGTKLFRRSNKFEQNAKDNFIYLSDIIKLYENQLNIATRDYSPGDTTVTVNPSSNPITRLNKQRNFYIIDGKTFTDVTGLSEDSPNGLVQVELCRRFNLWTHRLQVHGSNNYGFVNYVIAKVNFSKIENKLKGLPLRNQLIVENNAIVSPYYATNLDYLRYENLGATFDLNLFLFDAPDFKYTFFLDAGLHYGHTPIIDSNYQLNQGGIVSAQNPTELDAHNFTIFPRAKVQLFAERRYGLSLSYQANYTWLFTNNRFKQVMSYSGKGQDLNTLSTNKSAHWSHTIEAAFYIDVNPTSTTGKIFTTARFFFQQGDVNTFYPQILLGYAFNIFK